MECDPGAGIAFFSSHVYNQGAYDLADGLEIQSDDAPARRVPGRTPDSTADN